jgi:hypothetical protein
MRSSASILGLATVVIVSTTACETRSLVVNDATADVDARDDLVAHDSSGGDIVGDSLGDVVASDATDSVEDATSPTDAAEGETGADATEDDAALDAVVDALDAPFDAMPADDADDALAAGWTRLGSGACNARQRAVPVQDAIHVDFDASITWLTNPPSSGPHYPLWAHWGTFPDIPPGYWVHNLEHSGVVFLHSCVSGTPGCDAIVAALDAGVATIPDDPVCTTDDASTVRVRVVVTHYEPLDTPIAGAAWGWLYAADCVDPESMRLFYAMHSGMTYENFCADGYYP